MARFDFVSKELIDCVGTNCFLHVLTGEREYSRLVYDSGCIVCDNLSTVARIHLLHPIGISIVPYLPVYAWSDYSDRGEVPAFLTDEFESVFPIFGSDLERTGSRIRDLGRGLLTLLRPFWMFREVFFPFVHIRNAQYPDDDTCGDPRCCFEFLHLSFLLVLVDDDALATFDGGDSTSSQLADFRSECH